VPVAPKQQQQCLLCGVSAHMRKLRYLLIGRGAGLARQLCVAEMLVSCTKLPMTVAHEPCFQHTQGWTHYPAHNLHTSGTKGSSQLTPTQWTVSVPASTGSGAVAMQPSGSTRSHGPCTDSGMCLACEQARTRGTSRPASSRLDQSYAS
jgi:hypothetical protein